MMLSDVCLTSDVCLSRTAGVSREQRGLGIKKIGTDVAHVIRDSVTAFKVKRSKIALQGTGTYCGGLPHSLFETRCMKSLGFQ